MDLLAGMTRKKRQRALQIGLGFTMLVIVILVELLAIAPTGIYSYTTGGYKAFKINSPKQRILAEINRVPAIRTLITCDPHTRSALVTQRHFTYTRALETSDAWIARYRKKNVLLFLFQNQKLDRILLLKTRMGQQISSPLFDQCDTFILQNVDRFLEEQAAHQVFYK